MNYEDKAKYERKIEAQKRVREKFYNEDLNNLSLEELSKYDTIIANNNYISRNNNPKNFIPENEDSRKDSEKETFKANSEYYRKKSMQPRSNKANYITFFTNKKKVLCAIGITAALIGGGYSISESYQHNQTANAIYQEYNDVFSGVLSPEGYNYNDMDFSGYAAAIMSSENYLYVFYNTVYNIINIEYKTDSQKEIILDALMEALNSYSGTSSDTISLQGYNTFNDFLEANDFSNFNNFEDYIVDSYNSELKESNEVTR